MDASKTGCFIREQRKKLGFSQQKLAEMLYVEPQTVSKWERGLGMPDYDNVERLKEIFGCSLSDILEPSDTIEEFAEVEEDSSNDNSTNLPVLVKVLSTGEDEKKKKFSFFDFLSKKKIKEAIRKIFGYEYESSYTEGFLFKDVFKKRSKEDLEVTITQGMFKGKASHKSIGIEAPWLYMKVFFFMLICTAISLVVTVAFWNPVYFIFVGGLCAVVPLLIFLFECNFARNLTIIDVGKIFLIGGLCSLVLTLVLSPSAGEVVTTVLFAPIFEELAKALVCIIFVSKIKPKNMLTGLLIGFSVGAGFSVFETFGYAFDSYIVDFFYSDGDTITAFISSLSTLIGRTFWDFFSGHHYWTAIFCASYVLFKRETTFNFSDIFQWRVVLGYLIPVLLHMSWNASAFISSAFFGIVVSALICVCSISILIFLINIGINQTLVMGVYEIYQTNSKADFEVKFNEEVF